ncbi:MAG: tetraacyldisaccharide 4'-kinase, partial [Halanaerobiales bacterium]
MQVKVVLEVDNKLGIYLLGVISGEKRGPLAFILRFLFSLLEWLYNLIIFLRYFFYRIGIFKIRKLPCTVISIGNITTGG